MSAARPQSLPPQSPLQALLRKNQATLPHTTPLPWPWIVQVWCEQAVHTFPTRTWLRFLNSAGLHWPLKGTSTMDCSASPLLRSMSGELRRLVYSCGSVWSGSCSSRPRMRHLRSHACTASKHQGC